MLILSSDPRRPPGFTLIEVLVAIVVLSLGVLGFAALQITGLRSNHSAYLRSQASMFAYSIIDQMRANKAAASNGKYNISMSDTTSSCTTVACNDLAIWKQNLGAILPAGNGSISQTTPAPNTTIFTVIIQWNDSRDSADPPQQFAMSTEL